MSKEKVEEEKEKIKVTRADLEAHRMLVKSDISRVTNDAQLIIESGDYILALAERIRTQRLKYKKTKNKGNRMMIDKFKDLHDKAFYSGLFFDDTEDLSEVACEDHWVKYSKEFSYIVPVLLCGFCNITINPGESLYSVSVQWGKSRIACKKCYEKHEIS